uniref:leucine--tRNA ligase n=1 Tax=Eptatretus burgeri TaxID=7764 RepID=A0A8C4Q0U7_EPTBU
MLQVGKSKFYVLSMFPYPSGKLHMGHVRVYTIGDAIAHFHRLQGKKVLHPMGWDAFGLPAENAALEHDLDPEIWTNSNITHMREQLKNLGFCFDWHREITTCRPDYYKWTQYLFVKLFEAGLAYQKEAIVNWDPMDKTVLADEQVDEAGCSWRSGARVEQRFIKHTCFKPQKSSLYFHKYLPEWYGVKSMQANWLGDCSGCRLHFALLVSLWYHKGKSVFLFHSCLFSKSYKSILFGTCCVVPAGILLGVKAVHPLTMQQLPVVISLKDTLEDHVDCMIGFHPPSNIFIFCLLVEQFSGFERTKAAEAVMQYARDLCVGGHPTSTKLRDWLVSRQRYWGTPIPIVHCPSCGPVAVPVTDLPVHLPNISHLSEKGGSPLKSAHHWLHCSCPRCGSKAQRETDTLDTFVDSAWYFLRYTDPHNTQRPFDKVVADTWMPVDVYVGGKEHAVMHLYYARFLCHFCNDMGLLSHREPFKKLIVQGLIKGQTFWVPSTRRYVQKACVEFTGGLSVLKKNGERVVITWEKMSKSKQNGVDPSEAFGQYGCSTVRLWLLYTGPPEQDLLWDVQSDKLTGVLRWQKRLWMLVTQLREVRACGTIPNPSCLSSADQKIVNGLRDNKNLTIEMVMPDNFLYHLLYFMLFLITKLTSEKVLFFETYSPFVTISFLGAGLCSVTNKQSTCYDWKSTVLQQRWPVMDSFHCVQINNKSCGRLAMAACVARDADAVRALVEHSDIGKRLLTGQTVTRTILSPRTNLVNFLVH